MEDTKIITMPVIALRGLTMLPEMTISFDISRKKSVAAVEKAMVGDQRVCLVAQKDPEIMDPTLDQLYHIGTVSYIKQLVKMPGGIVRVMAEGQERAELLDLDSTEPALIGEVLFTEEQEADVDGAAAEAMSRILKEKLESYGRQHPKFSKEILPGMMVCEDLESLMLQMASELPWDYKIRQAYLEETTLAGQYEVLLSNLIHEIEVSQIHRELQEKVKENIDKNQKDYILREQMKVIREELGEDLLSDADEYEKQLASLKADKEVKEKLQKEIDRLKGMPGGGQESNVIRTYIETLLELPWNKMSKDNNDIKHAKQILEEDHYGLEQVKERVLEYLAVRVLAKKGNSPIICLVGPPGTGKTTIAKVIAHTTKAEFTQINATVAGKKDMEDVVRQAKDNLGMYGKHTILFVDEIHRFNKSQQDYLLPFVEDGTLILIGATTENPYFEVNGALLSRSIVFELKALEPADIKQLLKRALTDMEKGMGAYQAVADEDALDFLADIAGGDARNALNALELGILTTEKSEDGKIHITLEVASQCIQKKVVRYDKGGDNHYDTISAFIKSMRGSDPDAAVFYLAKMLYAGEDIKFIARRIMICASEDVGNADPQAIQVAVAAAQAVERIGMPEAQIILSQAASYVAGAPKSNAACNAIFDAMAAVKSTTTTVPVHLQDKHYGGAEKLGHGIGYKYAHDYPEHYVKQQYLPDELVGQTFYHPTDIGYEKVIGDRLKRLRERDQ